MKKQNIQTVTSIDIPELQPYRTLRRPMEHFKQGIFIAEGEKVVRRLLTTEIQIISLLLTHEWYEALSADHALDVVNRAKMYVTTKELVESIVGYNLHQGIMAIGKLPNERSLEETIRSFKQTHFCVALDGLVNAENVGVVVRNCAAFGVNVIITGETSSSPYLRRAVRNSMGTVFQLNVVHSKNLRESLTLLKEKYKTRIIATHPHGQSTIYRADFSGNICIVLGNEGDGISLDVLQVCTHQVSIPMMNETDSVNVGSASAVFLYEASKHRTAHI